MRILVLGSAAGGGFPQWNCNCGNCTAVRRGERAFIPRTQSAIAVSDDGAGWVLVNASPDLRTQLAMSPLLQPARGPRDSAIGAVLLTDAQLDHVAGLPSLREGERLPLYCTRAVRDTLATDLPLLSVLERYCGIDWHELPADGARVTLPAVPGLRFMALPLPGRAPRYAARRDTTTAASVIGLAVEDVRTGRTLFHAPAMAAVTPAAAEWLASADCLLVDGTFWRDDELVSTEVGQVRARDLGHLPLAGEGGMLEWLASARGRRILTHFNNTNPILDAGSPERALLAQHGVEVAYDGMSITL